MEKYNIYEKEVDQSVYLLYHMLMIFFSYDLPEKVQVMLELIIDALSDELNYEEDIPLSADILSQKLKVVTVYNN